MSIASPEFRLNPYIIGSPVDKPGLFFGRESLFQFIKDNLKTGAKVILLHGQRRIGKSSILTQIPKSIGTDEFAFVLFDLQDRSNTAIGKVLYYLAVEIVEQIGLDLDEKIPSNTELESNPYLFSQKFLPQVYKALKNRKLVLLMDEFDVLNNYNSEGAIEHFFPFLHSIIYQQVKLFLIPVVGRRLDDMPKLLSLFKEAPSQEISLLDEKSTTQLIIKPAERVLEYDSDAIQAIINLSAGHPYFTQLICFALFGQARERQIWQVSREDVEKIVDRAIEIGEAGLIWFRDGLPIPERVIFSSVAEAQKVTNIDPEASNYDNGISQVFHTSIRLQLSGQKTYEGLKFQWLIIEDIYQNNILDPKELVNLELPIGIDTTGGIIVTGRAPVWLYTYIMGKLTSTAWVASFDPRFGSVIVSSNLQQVRVGQVLPIDPFKIESVGSIFPLDLLEQYGVVQTQPLIEAGTQLIEWGFLDLKKRSKNSIYKVKIELVRRWLVKHYPLRKAIWELEKLYTEADFIYSKAIQFSQQGELSSALDLYSQVLDVNPNHFSALFEMAAIYLKIEDFGKAAELYTRAYQIDPLRNKENIVQALLGYGRDLRLQKEFILAKEELVKALEIESDNDEIHSLLAYITHEIENV